MNKELAEKIIEFKQEVQSRRDAEPKNDMIRFCTGLEFNWLERFEQLLSEQDEVRSCEAWKENKVGIKIFENSLICNKPFVKCPYCGKRYEHVSEMNGNINPDYWNEYFDEED